MAFRGDGQKFVGDDGFVKKATFGVEILGDAATPLPVGTYLITSVATPSGFPDATDGGLDPAAGDVIVVDVGIVITPLVGDNVVTLILEDQCDISSWQMEFSKEEIDVTTLCDAIKVYRAGKPDMAGTMNGVFTAGVSDAIDGNLRQFIDIVRQDGGLSFDRFKQEESIMLGFFYVNDDTNIADIMFVVAPFQLYGTSIGGELGSADSFSSSFRFANLTYTDSSGDVIPIIPTFHRIGDGISDT